MSININVALIKQLNNKEFLEEICKLYMTNKQHCFINKNLYIKVIKINKLVYTNLVNKDKILKTFEEKSYIIILTNDFNDFIIIYLLAKKLNLKEVLRKYLKFIKIRETLV